MMLALIGVGCYITGALIRFQYSKRDAAAYDYQLSAYEYTYAALWPLDVIQRAVFGILEDIACFVHRRFR